MNILAAPNSMKGSLDAFDFSDAIEKAFLDVSGSFKVKKIPVADGGDLTGEVLCRALNAKTVQTVARDPLGRGITVQYAVSGNTAIIEMANVSGMKLLDEEELNPMVASSYGTGELILDAASRGCTNILLGVGGSATVDGGSGMLQALGAKYFNSGGDELPGNGGALSQISSIRFTPLIHNIKINIISDVENPLLGENGAACVFGPQKGATPEMAIELEKGLSNWSRLLGKFSDKDIPNMPGAGAAGGIATGLVACLNARVVPGADFILGILKIDEAIKWADLVITGEGKIDGQTLGNKAPYAVAKRAKKMGKTVIAIGGAYEMEASTAFDGIFSIANKPMTIETAMENAETLVGQVAGQIALLVNKINSK
ncbi:Glycerate kinase [hydrothermal vent metagenome]|uniref:Glycerate kinase n=1 Tax=hydrothermal vent metagenome TaxID=652676 RepID=A0A3B0UNM8_9ZZZZ